MMTGIKVIIKVLLLMPMLALAETPITDVEEIIRRANIAAFYAGTDGRSETRMSIVDGQGRKQMRQFTILRRNHQSGGDQQFFVLFSRPGDIKRTSFLVEKHIEGDDDRWIYLPGLDLVKRISAGDKRTSFVGSHFFYEDVSGRGTHEDDHQLIETTDTHYIINSRPKQSTEVEFSEYSVWVDRESFIPVKTEYKDRAGKLYRRVEALAIEVIGGYPTTTKMKVSDLRSGGYTINSMRFIQYQLGLPASVFSERSLRNPPQQWLKRPNK